MELVKDIYFNTDKLVENTKIKVSYTGKFYQGNNEKVYLHYGYGENWNKSPFVSLDNIGEYSKKIFSVTKLKHIIYFDDFTQL